MAAAAAIAESKVPVAAIGADVSRVAVECYFCRDSFLDTAGDHQLSPAAAAAVFYHRVIATVASFLPPPPFLVSPSSRRQNLDTAQLSRAAAADFSNADAAAVKLPTVEVQMLLLPLLHAALQLKRRCPAGPSHMSLMLKTTSDEQATCRFTR